MKKYVRRQTLKLQKITVLWKYKVLLGKVDQSGKNKQNGYKTGRVTENVCKRKREINTNLSFYYSGKQWISNAL